MRFASLGSGSRGNAFVIEAGRTRVLIDCGFGPREAQARLGRFGLTPDDLTAILVTHEHSDHLNGVFALGARYAVAVHMTRGTCAAIDTNATTVECFDSQAAFAVEDLEIRPFPVPHDAREPVQFVISDGARRLGLLTDIGYVTRHVEGMLSGCDALVVECNHDASLLAASDYPARLKRRISGNFGHLSNGAAARLLQRINRAPLQHVVAAHLSQHNNRPELARNALAGALGCSPDWIGIADQTTGLEWRQIG